MGTLTTSTHCLMTPSQTNISKFISNNARLTMLENHCTTMQDLKQIHAHLIKTGLSKDPIAISRVLAFSATSPCADINYAYSVFAHIENPNLFMWNTIIRGFSLSSSPQNAISVFIDMLTTSPIEPQRLTYPSLFKAYAHLGLACDGAQLHGRIIKTGLEFDPFVRNTIIYMYVNSGFISEAYRVFDEHDFDLVAWNSMIMGLAKSGDIDESRSLFEKMGSKRNSISWNSMISGFVRNGKLLEAMDMFQRMQEEGIRVSEFTMVSLLNACAHLGSLEKGEWVYNYICKNKFDINLIMVTAIVDMYCKCGHIEKARRVFDSVSIKGLSTWNSMILGLANNGCEEDAIQLFSKLLSSNIEPNDVTFLGILTACKYLGNACRARDYFLLMKEKYNIDPSIKHYNCMVDVLGQGGFLDEAIQLIKNMAIEPDFIIWGSLLSACRKHENIEMAAWAASHITETESNDSAAYILMSNAYASLGNYENAVKQRVLMREKRVLKERGGSLIEINGEVQEFASAGKLKPEMQELILNLQFYCQDNDNFLTEQVEI